MTNKRIIKKEVIKIGRIEIGEPHSPFDYISEKSLAECFDRNDVAYIYTHQSPKTLSLKIKEKKAKRPDFIINGEIEYKKFGTYFVDAKTSSSNKYKCFTLSFEDYKKYKNLEESFNILVYIAYPINNWMISWGFISLQHIKNLYAIQKDESLLEMRKINYIRIPLESLLIWM